MKFELEQDEFFAICEYAGGSTLDLSKGAKDLVWNYIIDTDWAEIDFSKVDVYFTEIEGEVNILEFIGDRYGLETVLDAVQQWFQDDAINTYEDMRGFDMPDLLSFLNESIVFPSTVLYGDGSTFVYFDNEW